MTQSAILVVEDDLSLQAALCDTLALAGFRAEAASTADCALDLIRKSNYDMVVSDVQMQELDGHELLKRIKAQRPDLPVLLMTAYGSVQKAVEAMREGAVDYLVKPFEAEVLVNLVSQIVSKRFSNDCDFIAVDKTSKKIMALAQRVAESDATVMINGDSGVGKEVLARFIHKKSPRSNKPFVAINCAAIPDNMLEATLFGYEKGAFTGAYKACTGKFEQAQKGTLLLDEISEMDINLQAKLLRVLQEKEVERLGGNKLIPLDVRILATSNRDMKKLVSDGKFREDLYYRLNVLPIKLPGLKKRKEDIVPLALRFLARSAKSYAKPVPKLSDSAANRLIAYSWPGNVRELDNVIQRALVLHTGNYLTHDDVRFDHIESRDELSSTAIVEPASTQGAIDASETGKQEGDLQNDMKSHEYKLILKTLDETGGSRKLAAEKMGVSQRTLRYKLAKMRDLGIKIH